MLAMLESQKRRTSAIRYYESLRGARLAAGRRGRRLRPRTHGTHSVRHDAERSLHGRRCPVATRRRLQSPAVSRYPSPPNRGDRLHVVVVGDPRPADVRGGEPEAEADAHEDERLDEGPELERRDVAPGRLHVSRVGHALDPGPAAAEQRHEYAPAPGGAERREGGREQVDEQRHAD